MKKKFFFTLLLWLNSVFATGIPFYGNQSYLHWKTAETEHFIYHYPSEYTDNASIVAAYAEAVYDSVVSRYRVHLPGKVHLVMENPLYANGMAIPNENTMHIALTNWDFKVRSSHHWLTDVITHEFSHLVSIESASKFSPSIYGLQISYTDYYNERLTQNFMGFYPFTLQPLWFAEGTAQYESSRMGFDAWDRHRDMLLRVATLNDQLLDLGYMQDFGQTSLEAELGPYTQGFSLVRYIASHYGENAIPKIWSELSRLHRVTLDAALKQVIGIGEKELFENWKMEIKTQYETQEKAIGTLVTGDKWTEKSFYQDFPVIAGGNIYGVSNFGGPRFDGGIFKMPKNAQDSTVIQDTSVTKDTITLQDSILDITQYSKSGFKLKKAWLSNGISVRNIGERGPVLAYVSYTNRDRDGRPYFDIVLTDTSGNTQTVTYLADASYPDINAQGTEIVFARREPNSSRFALSTVAIPDKKQKTAEESRDIFIPDTHYANYNIYTPKFSPDGKRIVFSYFDDETRGIALIDRDGKNFKNLGQKGFDLRDPNWIDNGTLIYSSNRNGIYNLYSLNLNTGAEFALTNVIGGAFTPAVDSGTIFYTGYDKDGFSLYSLKFTDYGATRDSVLRIADTTLTTCPTANPAGTDSTVVALPCRIDTLITQRDSTIKKNITPVLTLNGTLAPKIVKPLEMADIAFSGAERNYKPIPVIPMIVPLVSIEERAPDFGAIGNSDKITPKIGLALGLSDPLKKNSLEAGLLLEVGNGLDYINSDGLNPRMEREFYISFENRSTPVTLQLLYSHMNFVSKDTVRYEDPRSYEDSIAISNYAIPLNAIVASAGYSIFKTGDSVVVSGGYDWADFNLYEDNLSWTYQKRLSAGISLSLQGGLSEESSSNTSGQGNGIFLSYLFSNADLYREGTFAESFTVSASGAIEPNYRTYNIHTLGLSLFGSLPNPIHDGARFAGGASVSGILDWNTRDSKDTLDRYYYEPLFLEGYPYLITSEDYNRSGIKVAKAEIHYLFPIYNDFRNEFWIFTTRDLYVDAYAQVGSAWNDSGFPAKKLKDTRFWDRSVGLEIRIANRIFYSIPFDISLNLARGLDRIGENAEGRGGRKMNPIDVPLLPEMVSPTRIGFTIGMGFNDRWKQ